MAAQFRLVDTETGNTVVDQLSVADTFASRLIGLQFQSPLPAGKGLLIVPCNSVHTCWLRFALDLAMFDRQGRVLQVTHGVQPWRLVWGPPQTYAVLEVAAQSLAVTVGQCLQLQAITPGSPISKLLAGLACRSGER